MRTGLEGPGTHSVRLDHIPLWIWNPCDPPALHFHMVPPGRRDSAVARDPLR